MPGRKLLPSLLLPVLRPDDATAVSHGADTLTLVTRSGTHHHRYRDIRSIELAPGPLWSAILINHFSGTTTLSGYGRADAASIAKRIDAARIHWWRRALAAHLEPLTSARGKLLALRNPPAYITTRHMGRLVSDARKAVSAVPAPWPPEMADSPEIVLLHELLRFIEDAESRRGAGNAAFIAAELQRSRQFFDTIESQPLSDEQRAAVVTDETRNLVLASAGSGKTSVIVAKTCWLIHKRYLDPSQILLLAFAKGARDEMQHRLDTRLGEAASNNLTVQTFHSLGLSIIGAAEGKRPSLAPTADDPAALTRHIAEIVEYLHTRQHLPRTLLEWFQGRIVPYRSPHDFANWHDYWNHIRKYDVRSLNGDRVASMEECEIANFLFLNGVPYLYEQPYEHDTATSEKRQYLPDFRIAGTGIYIEHFGLDAKGRTAPYVNRDKYLSDMNWKRDLHRRHDTILLETFTHQRRSGTLLPNLQRALEAHGVKFSPIPSERVFARLNELGQIDPFARLTATFLTHFKSTRLSTADIARQAHTQPDPDRARAFLAAFQPIHNRYEESLGEAGQIDFHDMIARATDHIAAGKYKSPYRYILVDEFQDISPARANLIKALLRQHPSARLFAVGDDWQAISRYTGSDIGIIRDFAAHFGSCNRLELQTTFRCPDRVAAVATRFILRNPSQIVRPVRTVRVSDRPAVHLGLAQDPEDPLFEQALKSIAAHAANHPGESRILILGRYRSLRPANMRKLPRQYPNLRFSYSTIHAAKGLEADYVVLLGLVSGKFAFPTEISDDPLFDLVLTAPERHPNAEERRLFYVALTRARREAYLLSDTGEPSRFATELAQGGYDVTLFGPPPRPSAPCPLCADGRMTLRRNARDGTSFYSCSNRPRCQHRQPPCPACETGLPVRTDTGLRCQKCDHAPEPCPSCDGWLREVAGPRGRFIGCINYPRCKHTQTLPPDGRQPEAPQPEPLP